MPPDTSPQRMVVTADDAVIVVRGSVAVFDALRPAGFRPIYVGGGLRGWTVDRRRRGVDRLPDVVAALENAGHYVRIKSISSITAEPMSSIVAPRREGKRANALASSHSKTGGPDIEGLW